MLNFAIPDIPTSKNDICCWDFYKHLMDKYIIANLKSQITLFNTKDKNVYYLMACFATLL